MTEKQARRILKKQGWTPRTRHMRGTVKLYLYAYRRNKESRKTEERYVGRVEGLAGMSAEDIVKRIS